MNNLDYATGNAITRFPFKDTAPLTWYTFPAGSTGQLSNKIFKDVRIISKYNDLVTVYLDSIAYSFTALSNPAGGVIQLHFKVDPTLGPLTNPYALTIELPYGQDIGNTVDNYVRIQAEIDSQAFVEYLIEAEAEVADTIQFGPENTFCLSTYVYKAPKAEITFSNQLDTATEETLVVKTSGSISIEGGTNINLSGTSQLNVDLVPGGGLGLFDACEDLGNVVRTLNGITADAYKNFSLTKDACYDITPGSHALTISNHCKPECAEEELKNFAHYANRLKDGVVSMTDEIKKVKDKYDGLVTKYVNVVDISKKPKPVFMSVESHHTENRVFDFSSITAGIYSPNKTSVHPVSVLVKASSHHYTYVQETSYLTQKGSKIQLASPGFTGQTLHCNDVIYTGFVLATKKPAKDKPEVNLGEDSFDVSLIMTAGTGGGYAAIPLLVGSPNFSINYSKLKDTSTNKTTIKLSTYPFSKTPGAVPMSLNFECSPNMVFKKGSYSSGSSVAINIPSRFGFNSTLDLTHSTICQMEYEVTGSGLNLDFNVKLETPSGSAIKTIPFSV